MEGEERLNTYLDEPVLGKLTCRLVPPDNRYPDCVCTLMLTELRLYVIEDNYNGTDTEHFAIPIQRVLRIERQGRFNHDGSGETVTVEPKGWKRYLYRLIGPFAQARRESLWHELMCGLFGGLHNANDHGRISAQEYVRVLYRTEDGGEASLYFSEAGNPYTISRELEKYQERWGLVR